MNPEDKILEDIIKDGYFYFSSNKWEEFENAVKSLVSLGLISTLAEELRNNENNYCYIYVAAGNPTRLFERVWIDPSL